MTDRNIRRRDERHEQAEVRALMAVREYAAAAVAAECYRSTQADMQRFVAAEAQLREAAKQIVHIPLVPRPTASTPP